MEQEEEYLWERTLTLESTMNYTGKTKQELLKRKRKGAKFRKCGMSYLFKNKYTMRIQDRIFANPSEGLELTINLLLKRFVSERVATEYLKNYGIDLDDLVSIGFPIIEMDDEIIYDVLDLNDVVKIKIENQTQNLTRIKRKAELFSPRDAYQYLWCDLASLKVLNSNGLLTLYRHKGELAFHMDDLGKFAGACYDLGN